jgi:electron transport complex protein RnfB
MLKEVLTAVAVFVGLGIVHGVGIGVAAKFLEVKEDPRLAQVTKMLPGYNCGSCGRPGCAGLAADIVAGKASPTSCKPGKQDMREAIKSYLETTPGPDGEVVTVKL